MINHTVLLLLVFLFLFLFFLRGKKIREKILRSQDSGIRQAWDESLLTPILYYGINTINTYS